MKINGLLNPVSPEWAPSETTSPPVGAQRDYIAETISKITQSIPVHSQSQMYQHVTIVVDSQQNKRSFQYWTYEEDQKLLLAVEKYGSDWDLIATVAFPDTRNAAQCRLRFEEGINPNISRKAWTAQEITRLKDGLIAYAKCRCIWKLISTNIFNGKRTPGQCRRKARDFN